MEQTLSKTGNFDSPDNSPEGLPSIGGKHILTGAFGYSGGWLARLLLSQGAKVHTLVNNKQRPSSDELAQIEVHDLNFNDHDGLVQAMSGAEVFYNTYWVRFNHRNFTYEQAVTNTKKLFAAAKEAKVPRVVHISIANPSVDSPFEYFRGKAVLEKELKASGLSYAILRPAVLFGGADILINNISWAVRHFPVLGVFGWGQYGIRPIHVRDLARLMFLAGQELFNKTLNAVGPERYSYIGLVKKISEILGLKRLIVPCPPVIGYGVGKVVGWLQRDVFITWPEIKGLMANLLDTPESFDDAPGRTLLSAWAEKHKNELGRTYASELARR